MRTRNSYNFEKKAKSHGQKIRAFWDNEETIDR